MIFIFSNVTFSAQEAPKVGPDDLLVFLNKAANIEHYRDHFRKVVYHRSPEECYGPEIMGCVNRYVFSAGKASVPGDFIDELKRAYDWNYPIEAGKTKCMTTGYMVAMYLRKLYPDEEIALVNFGFAVKKSTYRCPWHNWKFEDGALAGFRHIYTETDVPTASKCRGKVFYELFHHLGDNVYSSAVVANLRAAGYAVNVSENNNRWLWDSCPILVRKITRENADIVIRQRYRSPWNIGCPQIIEDITNAAAIDLKAEIPIHFRCPHIWAKLPEERLIEEPYVVINAGWLNSTPLKKWSRERWEELLKLCPDVRFAQMGMAKHHAVPLPGVIDMIDKTPNEDYLRLIRDAACVISPPSSSIHIAAAYKVPSIMLAGGREPAELAKYPETVALSTCGGSLECCKTGGCGRFQFGTGAKECGAFQHGADGMTAQCMLDITAEEVAEALRKIIKKES